MSATSKYQQLTSATYEPNFSDDFYEIIKIIDKERSMTAEPKPYLPKEDSEDAFEHYIKDPEHVQAQDQFEFFDLKNFSDVI